MDSDKQKDLEAAERWKVRCADDIERCEPLKAIAALANSVGRILLVVRAYAANEEPAALTADGQQEGGGTDFLQIVTEERNAARAEAAALRERLERVTVAAQNVVDNAETIGKLNANNLDGIFSVWIAGLRAALTEGGEQ